MFNAALAIFSHPLTSSTSNPNVFFFFFLPCAEVKAQIAGSGWSEPELRQKQNNLPQLHTCLSHPSPHTQTHTHTLIHITTVTNTHPTFLTHRHYRITKASHVLEAHTDSLNFICIFILSITLYPYPPDTISSTLEGVEEIPRLAGGWTGSGLVFIRLHIFFSWGSYDSFLLSIFQHFSCPFFTFLLLFLSTNPSTSRRREPKEVQDGGAKSIE